MAFYATLSIFLFFKVFSSQRICNYGFLRLFLSVWDKLKNEGTNIEIYRENPSSVIKEKVNFKRLLRTGI